MEMFSGRIALGRIYRSEGKIAADFDITQLIPSFGKRFIQKGGEAYIGRIIHPVAAFHNPDRLIRGFQLALIFIIKTAHGKLLFICDCLLNIC